MIDIKKAKKTFKKYVKKYDMTNPNIKRKYYHSFRVSELCGELATALHLDEEYTNLAMLIGLLHDIGRFEQIKLYNTFDDLKSIDHGGLGVELLFDKGLIRDYIKTDEYDEIIKKTIYNHNKIAIPDTYNSNETLFSKIIRDADKIDIFRIKSEAGIHKFEDEAISEGVVDCIINRSPIDLKMKKTPLDEILVTIGFLYDINFVYSYEIIRRENYLNLLFDSLELKEDKSIKIFNYIEQFLNNNFDILR